MVPVTMEMFCPICNKGFKGKTGLGVHLSKSHTTAERNSINSNASNPLSITSNGGASQQPINPSASKIDPMAPIDQFLIYLKLMKSHIRVIKRIPKAARFHASQEYTKVLNFCVNNMNNIDAWFRLLSFPYVAFKSPDRKDKSTSKLSLATIIKRNLVFWTQIQQHQFNDFFNAVIPKSTLPRKVKKKLDADEMRIKTVQSKLNDGDVSGAIRILSSNDSIAPVNVETYAKLLELHPAPSIKIEFNDSILSTISTVTESELKIAVSKFRNGSAGGLDGIRPQHLKDMLSIDNGSSATILTTRLATFTDLLLNGKAPQFIVPILFGASLCALNKKTGSIRPIAVGSVYRRLTAKIACARIMDETGAELRPFQLGYGTKGGAEAGAHAARCFINSDHQSPKVFLKLDFQNAFNELERDCMLLATYEKCPGIYSFIKQCYFTPTKLTFGDYELLSQRGCQKGDPCGPAIFCITIHEMISRLKSELNIWYLDDGSLGGSPEVVLEDLATIIEESSKLGLKLNFSKCELMILGDGDQRKVFEEFNKIAPGIIWKTSEIDLLGAPLTDGGIPAAINSKLETLRRMVDRLNGLNSHQAFFLIRQAVAIPKFTYLLRTTPCWHAMDDLKEYDQFLRTSLETIMNCQLDSTAWNEASLPVKCGGLGLRSVTNLCFTSFLGSYHSTSDLLQQILPRNIQPPIRLASEAFTVWHSITGKDALVQPESKFQHNWDNHLCHAINQSILEVCSSDIDQARMLANVSKNSSSWLNALPCSSLGTLLDDQSFRISISLRLGLPMCHPHLCVCGAMVDKFGRHGLACKKSFGRKSRHESINDLIKRALATCGFPAIREPPGCSRADGKKPDGLTLIPWKRGKPLVWDFTCADTVCQSYLKTTRRQAGTAARTRENAKKVKYASLENNFIFCPVSVETFGSWGEEGSKLIDTIGKKLQEVSGEKKSRSYFLQRISIANQRGNAASILGTIPECTDKLEEIYYVI